MIEDQGVPLDLILPSACAVTAPAEFAARFRLVDWSLEPGQPSDRGEPTWCYAWTLLDTVTRARYPNGVRLLAPEGAGGSLRDAMDVARLLLQTWAAERAKLILHEDHGADPPPAWCGVCWRHRDEEHDDWEQDDRPLDCLLCVGP